MQSTLRAPALHSCPNGTSVNQRVKLRTGRRTEEANNVRDFESASSTSKTNETIWYFRLRASAMVRPELQGLDACRTLSFCPNLSCNRFAG
jgi:hypothetical protein